MKHTEKSPHLQLLEIKQVEQKSSHRIERPRTKVYFKPSVFLLAETDDATLRASTASRKNSRKFSQAVIRKPLGPLDC